MGSEQKLTTSNNQLCLPLKFIQKILSNPGRPDFHEYNNVHGN